MTQIAILPFPSGEIVVIESAVSNPLHYTLYGPDPGDPDAPWQWWSPAGATGVATFGGETAPAAINELCGCSGADGTGYLFGSNISAESGWNLEQNGVVCAILKAPPVPRVGPNGNYELPSLTLHWFPVNTPPTGSDGTAFELFDLSCVMLPNNEIQLFAVDTEREQLSTCTYAAAALHVATPPPWKSLVGPASGLPSTDSTTGPRVAYLPSGQIQLWYAGTDGTGEKNMYVSIYVPAQTEPLGSSWTEVTPSQGADVSKFSRIAAAAVSLLVVEDEPSPKPIRFPGTSPHLLVLDQVILIAQNQKVASNLVSATMITGASADASTPPPQGPLVWTEVQMNVTGQVSHLYAATVWGVALMFAYGTWTQDGRSFTDWWVMSLGGEGFNAAGDALLNASMPLGFQSP